MKKEKTICFILILMGMNKLYSVEDKYTYIGANLSPLLAMAIPNSSFNPKIMIPSLMYRKYNDLNKGIRFLYGVELGSQSAVQSMMFGLDFDSRRFIHEKWLFFHGVGGRIFYKGTSDRIVGNLVQEEISIGACYHWGFEYYCNPILSFSVETALRVGLSDDVANNDIPLFVKFDPPINLMAHFMIN